ncbi:uncharacterized protein LOC129574481 [Sitodiplosis mosellana]|uniref:uncharacterized protein LOC129574481 n=1 Tax=Sitodiplosis mosellana TaxID=263140 RepID=UPI002443E154|nr:uncharacterized protein LOC129574481 [Sitodiplosis mosellana]
MSNKLRHYFDFCVQIRSHKTFFFKLNEDCFNEIFNRLPLKDLNSLAQTCKRLHDFTSKYFQQHFATVEVHYGKDGPIAFESIRVDAFSQFIQRLSIHRVDLCSFRNIAATFKSLKELNLMGLHLTAPKIECLKKIFEKIEILKIRDIEIEADGLHFLKFCNNLQRLSVRNLKTINTSFEMDKQSSSLTVDNGWLRQKYPNLKHFELIEVEILKFCDVLAFFKENPNIRSFSTDTKFLSRFEHLITEVNVSLNDLTIVRDCKDDLINQSISIQLNHLHKLGFYERLHWIGAYLPFEGRTLQTQIDQLSRLQPLKTLRFKALVYVIPHVDLSELINVTELSMIDPQMGTSIGKLASELLNLERISFTHAFLDDITPFVVCSKKLKEIHLYGDIRSSNDIIYLRTLNKSRTKLEGASKVTIHANDTIYTETKWAIGETNFRLIELKRS